MKLANITYSFKHRIFLQNFIFWFGRHTGICFFLYYLMEEGSAPVPDSGSDPEGYEVCLINGKDLQDPDQFGALVHLEQWRKRLEKGDLCITLRKSGQVAAYCWADSEELHLRAESRALKKGEAYLYDAHVEKSFRGQGLAPYMRKQCYQMLNARGFHKFYSVSDYFNTPTHKFKKKLNARKVRLVLSIELRNKKELCHMVIRDYSKRDKLGHSKEA